MLLSSRHSPRSLPWRFVARVLLVTAVLCGGGCRPWRALRHKHTRSAARAYVPSPVRVLADVSSEAVWQPLIQLHSRSSRDRLQVEFADATSLEQAVRAGRADVVLTPDTRLVQRLANEGVLDPRSVEPLRAVALGLIVHAAASAHGTADVRRVLVPAAAGTAAAVRARAFWERIAGGNPRATLVHVGSFPAASAAYLMDPTAGIVAVLPAPSPPGNNSVLSDNRPEPDAQWHLAALAQPHAGTAATQSLLVFLAGGGARYWLRNGGLAD